MAPKAKKRGGAGGTGTASARPPVRAPAAKKKRPQANSETHDSRRQKVTHGVVSAVGQMYMLFRIFVVGVGYTTCAGIDPGHVADSRVHRFERVVGFKRASRSCRLPSLARRVAGLPRSSSSCSPPST